MLLNQFNELHAEFAAEGVAVHAITGEPEGEAVIRERMERNGLEKLAYPVHSDPDWSLMTLKPKEMYVEDPSPEGIKKNPKDGTPTGRPDYRMVQPAVAIVDREGVVRFWWSWNKLQDGGIFKLPNGKVMQHPNARSAKNPTGNTHDVRWRPLPKDILARIKAGSDLGQIAIDNIGAPNKKDHKHPVGLNFKPNPPGYAAKL